MCSSPLKIEIPVASKAFFNLSSPEFISKEKDGFYAEFTQKWLQIEDSE